MGPKNNNHSREKKRMSILNLTQHEPTAEQTRAGVRNPFKSKIGEILSLLNFDEIPSKEEIIERAERLAELADQCYEAPGPVREVMIGGAGFLASQLEQALFDRNMIPVYSFSRRESVETLSGDGEVVKTSVYRHLGFVPAIPKW